MAAQPRNKVLLMGKARAGKTSMKSIIFANYLAKDTERLGPTIRIAHQTLRFLGDLQLDLWDCGGQEKFLQSYFESHRDSIFRNVAVLIYVFDIESLQQNSKGSTSTGLANDMIKFESALGAIRQHSPNAKIFVLIHKMDVVARNLKEEIFDSYEKQLSKRARMCGVNIRCFPTSIWDETLFKAWSRIVCSLLSDAAKLQSELERLCELCQADEIVLFEAATLLFVSQATRKEPPDTYRFEKIANIVKQFKLRCTNMGRFRFGSMQVSNKHFKAYIGNFTQTTNILAVVSDPKIEMESVLMNLNASKKAFDELLQLHVGNAP